MLSSDSEEKWPAKLLTDTRVSHYWDADKILGTWYGEHVTAKQPRHVEWDAYFLYRADSHWDLDGDGPSHLISWGRTVVQTRERLKADLLAELGVDSE